MEMISPRGLARDRLLELYRRQTELLGRKPSGEEFFPVNLKQLAQLLLPDWKMLEKSDLLHGDVSSPILGKADFENKIIYLDAISGARQYYTAAHELGHVFLKHGGCQLRRDTGPRSILRPDQLQSPDANELRREKEANAFAAELLMPERAVLKEFKKRFQVDKLWINSSQAQLVLKTVYKMAADAATKLATIQYPNDMRPLTDFFGVSPSAMRIRLLELGLVY